MLFEPYQGIHEFDSYSSLVEAIKEVQFEYARVLDASVSKDTLKYYEYGRPEAHLSVSGYITKNK